MPLWHRLSGMPERHGTGLPLSGGRRSCHAKHRIAQFSEHSSLCLVPSHFAIQLRGMEQGGTAPADRSQLSPKVMLRSRGYIPVPDLTLERCNQASNGDLDNGARFLKFPTNNITPRGRLWHGSRLRHTRRVVAQHRLTIRRSCGRTRTAQTSASLAKLIEAAIHSIIAKAYASTSTPP
jgi:hypothetical protein